jgi:hypothetical protein
MAARLAICIAIVLACASCGSDGFEYDVVTDAPPVVTRVDPNAGRVGDTITIFGLGFSISYPENIVIIGNAATSAIEYELLANPQPGEIEAITAVVPDGAEVGEGPILVQVHGNSSNADVSFTVVP